MTHAATNAPTRTHKRTLVQQHTSNHSEQQLRATQRVTDNRAVARAVHPDSTVFTVHPNPTKKLGEMPTRLPGYPPPPSPPVRAHACLQAALCMTPSSIGARGAGGGGGGAVEEGHLGAGDPDAASNQPPHTLHAHASLLWQLAATRKASPLQYLKKYPRAHPWRTGVHESHP